MASQKPQIGLVELMSYLDSRNIPKAICTRNFDTPVMHLLDKFLPGSHFDPIVTREFRPPKPDPAGILHIAGRWGVDTPSSGETAANGVDGDLAGEKKVAEGLIMVGDSIDDMTAGFKAGAATVLLVNDLNRHLADHEHTDLVISRLDDLIEILESGFEGRVDGGQEKVDAEVLVEDAVKEEGERK